MRGLLMTVAMLGCGGGGGGPHEVTDCDPGVWSSAPRRCEQACAARPSAGLDADMNMADDRCTIRGANGVASPCLAILVAEYDGVLGCCVGAGDETVVFVECEAQ